MWRQYNPNPLRLSVGDCTVRAICAATNSSWEDVHKALCDLSREMGDMPSADRVWWSLLEQIGFTRQKMIDHCPDCYTVEQFAFDHPRGIYILGPHEHAVCIYNGDWMDSWDSGKTVPTYYFRRMQQWKISLEDGIRIILGSSPIRIRPICGRSVSP